MGLSSSFADRRSMLGNTCLYEWRAGRKILVSIIDIHEIHRFNVGRFTGLGWRPGGQPGQVLHATSRKDERCQSGNLGVILYFCGKAKGFIKVCAWRCFFDRSADAPLFVARRGHRFDGILFAQGECCWSLK